MGGGGGGGGNPTSDACMCQIIGLNVSFGLGHSGTSKHCNLLNSLNRRTGALEINAWGREVYNSQMLRYMEPRGWLADISAHHHLA